MSVANEIEGFVSKFFVWEPEIKFRLVLIAEYKAYLKLDLSPVEDCSKRIKELNPDTSELSYVQTAAFTAVIGQKRANQSL